MTDRVHVIALTVLFALAILMLSILPAPHENVSTVVSEVENRRPDLSPVTPSPLTHNVVFVSFDALGASHVGHLGYSRNVTPTLDELAKQSCVFKNAYSVSSWTVPSSMTWFTGVYPSEHGMTNKFAVYNDKVQDLSNLSNLSPSLFTLAEIMKQNGALTAGFTGNAGVSGNFGYDQGFEVYYYPTAKFGSFSGSIPRAVKWLKRNKDKRFFMFLHGYDVHGQCMPDEGFDYRFRPKNYDGDYFGAPQEQELLREEGLEKGFIDPKRMSEEDVRFWRAIYDEKIQRADKNFAGFLEEFKKLGLMENTIIIITSDHGTEFYEHRRFDHGFTLYNELIHVPLLIKVPGQKEGKVIPERVSSIDLMPTILELANAKVPDFVQKQMRGQSLMPLMEGQQSNRNVFSETDYREHTYKRAIITPDGWKLVYTLASKTEGKNVRELYNLVMDPEEKRNLARSNPDKADELQKELFAHFRSIGHDLTKREWKIGENPVYQLRP